jgi:hypothetical protein
MARYGQGRRQDWKNTHSASERVVLLIDVHIPYHPIWVDHIYQLLDSAYRQCSYLVISIARKEDQQAGPCRQPNFITVIPSIYLHQ